MARVAGSLTLNLGVLGWVPDSQLRPLGFVGIWGVKQQMGMNFVFSNTYFLKYVNSGSFYTFWNLELMCIFKMLFSAFLWRFRGKSVTYTWHNVVLNSLFGQIVWPSPLSFLEIIVLNRARFLHEKSCLFNHSTAVIVSAVAFWLSNPLAVFLGISLILIAL